MWQKRHAAALLSQLPDDRENALLVLEYARELVEYIYKETSRPRLAVIGPFVSSVSDVAEQAQSLGHLIT